MNLDAGLESQAQQELFAGEQVGGGVIEALDRFQVANPPFLRAILVYLPLALAFFLLFDWLAGLNTFATDPLRLPAVLMAIAVLLVLGSLFAKTPEALRSVWVQGLVRPGQDGEDAQATFQRFLSRFQHSLNSRWAWAAGLTFAVGVFFFFQRLGFLGTLVGFILGLLFWRVFVIAYYITRLGRWFSIGLIPNHPDRSGGLKPVGDVCLRIAFVLLLPAIYLSFWGLAVTYFEIPGTQFYALVWSAVFRKLLIVLSAASMLLFFQPLYAIHQQMERRRQELIFELDRLSRKMGRLGLEIRSHADEMEIEQADRKMGSLELLEKVYQKNIRIPVWPLNWEILWKFTAAQAVPLLSLAGTSGPIIDLIKSILASL